MGANGFMGSHITRQLVAKGRRVRAMVRPTGDISALRGLDIEICHGDISDIRSVRDAMRGCGSVFYNVVDTRAWLVDPKPLYLTNVERLGNVIDASIAEKITRFIFTSSMVTLPRYSGSPASEEHAFDWWNEAPDYVKTRVLAEKAILDAVDERGLPAIMLCVANTYGPEDYGPTPHGNALWQATKSKGKALDCSLPTVDVRVPLRPVYSPRLRAASASAMRLSASVFDSKTFTPWPRSQWDTKNLLYSRCATPICSRR